MSSQKHTDVPVGASTPTDEVSRIKERHREIRKLCKLYGKNPDVHRAKLIGAIKATQLDLSGEIPSLLEIEMSTEDLQETAQTVVALLRGHIRNRRKKPTLLGRGIILCGSVLVSVGGVLIAVVALSLIPPTAGSMIPILSWVSRAQAIRGMKLYEILGLLLALGVALLTAGTALRSKGRKMTV